MYPFTRRPDRPLQRNSRPRKLTFSLRDEWFGEKHAGGANAVVVCGEKSVWTGGRDGTVREWVVGGGDSNIQKCVSSTEAHAGWVNSLVALGTGGGDFFVSGGSDRAVKCWRKTNTSTDPLQCVATLVRHTDYVTKIARGSESDPASPKFVSTGLGADQVYLWDVGCFGKTKNPIAQFTGQTNSAYASGVCANCHTIVTGDNKGVVRRFDSRAPHQKPGEFTGHTGTVRTLSVDPTGRLCLTGSSDGTLRLWDLGQGRCVQVLSGVHRGSVWSAAPDANWRSVVSGGADGAAYVTDLVKRRSQLLFSEKNGIVDLQYAGEGNSDASVPGRITVWSATSGCEINRWSKRVAEDDEIGGLASPGSSLRAKTARLSVGSNRNAPDQHGGWFAAGTGGASPGRRSSFSSPGLQGLKPRTNGAVKSFCIQGTAPVVEHQTLPDRRRVLCRDTDGGLALWDVTQFKVLERWEPDCDDSPEAAAASYGPADTESKEHDASEETAASSQFETVFARLKTPVPISVPSWFTVDSRGGFLSVTLTPSAAFQAEAYACEFSNEANHETKINHGVQTIHALFRSWLVKRKATARNDCDVGDDVEGHRNETEKEFDINSVRVCDDAHVFQTPKVPTDFWSPIFSFEPPEPEYDPASYGRGKQNQCVIFLEGKRMTGTRDEENLLPEWVVDVLHTRFKVPDAGKIGFFVTEDETESEGGNSTSSNSTTKYVGTGKTFSSGKVTAPRVLTIKKVAAYVVGKLQITLAGDVLPEQVVTICCDGQTLDPGFSLATVKVRIAFPKSRRLFAHTRLTLSFIYLRHTSGENQPTSP